MLCNEHVAHRCCVAHSCPGCILLPSDFLNETSVTQLVLGQDAGIAHGKLVQLLNTLPGGVVPERVDVVGQIRTVT